MGLSDNYLTMSEALCLFSMSVLFLGFIYLIVVAYRSSSSNLQKNQAARWILLHQVMSGFLLLPLMYSGLLSIVVLPVALLMIRFIRKSMLHAIDDAQTFEHKLCASKNEMRIFESSSLGA